jgi:hypothetical protein
MGRNKQLGLILEYDYIYNIIIKIYVPLGPKEDKWSNN